MRKRTNLKVFVIIAVILLWGIVPAWADTYDDGDGGDYLPSFFLLDNTLPVVDSISLDATSPDNLTTDNLTLSYTTSDPDGDSVKSITNWYKDGNSIMVLNMPFEGGSNSTFTKDYSSFRNNGEVVGATWNSTVGYDGFGAYEFDGSNDYIDLNTNFGPLGPDRTYEIWFNTDVLPTGISMIHMFGNYDNSHACPSASYDQVYCMLYGYSMDILTCAVSAGNTCIQLADTYTNLGLTTNTWYHLVLTIDWNGVNSIARLYLNGAEILNGTSAGQIGGLTEQDYFIGSGPDPGFSGRLWDGYLDEHRIYNRALSPEQIKALYGIRTDLIVSQETSEGDVWQACVTPNDGLADGNQSCSNNLTIKQLIYVDANTPDNNDGSSWAKAYKYLQDALADANSPPCFAAIRVADGNYYPDANTTDPCGTGNREATFQLISGVALYGGYAGYGATDPNARDIQLYETILSGDLDGNDTPGLDPCDLPDDPNRGENSFHVVTGNGTDDTAKLDGFTITAGNANSSAPHNYGGGMNNNAGSPTVTNCTFTGNSAVSAGGGMYNSSSSPSLTNCTFTGNSTATGGAICNGQGSSPTITNCTFSGNSASNDSSGWGGGIYNYFSSNPTIKNCTFSENSASGFGGGMYNYTSSPTVTNCILWGDSAPTGPEIYNFSSAPSVTYSDVAGSYAGTGNIDTDPCFADPCNGDYHLQSQAGSWKPASESWVTDANTSLCIDAGDMASLIGFEPFPNGGIINMGVYGGTAEASKSYFGEPVCETIVIGDINGDCIVNFLDFSLMAFHWLEDHNP